MAITLKDVKQFESQEILRMMLPRLDSLYKSVDYIGFTKEQFYQVALEQIDKSKKMYDGDIVYREYLKQQINLALINHLKNSLPNSEKAIVIINNYINKYLKRRLTYDRALNNLKKLNAFFELYDYIPEPYVLARLIEKSPIFLTTVEYLFEIHKMQIVAGNLEKIFDNKTIILILEIYCVLKDIKISKDKELEVGKSELTETVKTYLNEINSTPSLLPAEESVLVLKMMGGDGSARKTLVESHLNLVVSVANKYVGRGLPFWDLIQEGNLGLLVAVDKYNANDVFDFSTYSTFWIRSLIIKALTDKVRNIRIPAHIYEKIDLYKKTIINLEMVLNREPLKYEVAGEMGLSVSEVSTLHQLQFDALSANSASFEEEEFENSFSILEESAEDIVIANDRSFQLKELLKECELSRREKIILGLRYGFGRRKPMTLDEIGKEFGITREAVRQTERSLLKKIRATEYMKSYTAYMFNMNELSKSKEVEQIDEEKVPEMTIVEEMQKKDYKNMLKVLKSPSFTKIMSMCSVKNVMIVFLTSGYLDGKCFSPSAIATFFGIEEQEVVDIIKKVLPTYKEIIDKIMNDVDEELELNSYYMKLRRNK